MRKGIIAFGAMIAVVAQDVVNRGGGELERDKVVSYWLP